MSEIGKLRTVWSAPGVNKRGEEKFPRVAALQPRSDGGAGLRARRRPPLGTLPCGVHALLLLCFFQNMAKVQVNNVVVLDNPSPFYNPFQFEITFECIEDLSEGEYRSPDVVSAAPGRRMRGRAGSPRPGPAPAAARLSSPQSRAATRGCGAPAGPTGPSPAGKVSGGALAPGSRLRGRRSASLPAAPSLRPPSSCEELVRVVVAMLPALCVRGGAERERADGQGAARPRDAGAELLRGRTAAPGQYPQRGQRFGASGAGPRAPF